MTYTSSRPRRTDCQVAASDTTSLSTIDRRPAAACGWDARARRDGTGARSRGLLKRMILLRAIAAMRHNANEKGREAKDMAGLKKVVAVTVAAVVLAAFAVYLLRPTTSSNAGNVVINEPTSPPTPAPTGGDTGGGPTSPPPSPPPRASGGPKHTVCVPPNENIPDHARDKGANWYRFYGNDEAACGAFPGVRARPNANP